MTGQRDISEVLRDLAAEAPTVSLPAEALIGRVRQGRRVRQAATGAALLAVAVVVTGTAAVGMHLAAGPGPAGGSGPPAAAKPSGGSFTGQPGPGARSGPALPFPDCGEPVPTAGAAGPLLLTSGLPDQAPGDHGNSLRGPVTITNRGADPVTGTTSVQPEIWVARAGRIVALPAPMRALGIEVDLLPGAGRTFDTTVNLGRCVPGAAQPADPRLAEPLPAGTYELYAVQRVYRSGGAGSADPVLAHGGPWRLVIG